MLCDTRVTWCCGGVGGVGISHNPAHNHCNNYTISRPQSPAHVNKIVPQWCHGMPQTCHCVTWDAGECYSHKQDKQIKSGRNKNTSCTITIIVKTLHCQFILASGLLAGCLRSESFWWLALVKCCLTGYFLLLYLHGERTHRTTQGRQETGWHT